MNKMNNPLNEPRRESGFQVPEGYFENFTQRLMQQLPEKQLEKPTVVSLWHRVRPILYLAAMFAGMALIISVFVQKPTVSDITLANTSSNIEENTVYEDIVYASLNEYAVYEYVLNN